MCNIVFSRNEVVFQQSPKETYTFWSNSEEMYRESIEHAND
jgi:hypothetical protein